MKSLSRSPRVLRLCLLVLGAFQLFALFLAAERPALTYVDPGSGFVFLQVAGSMIAGSVYYLRHRIKKILHSLRKSSPISTPSVTQSEVIENQP